MNNKIRVLVAGAGLISQHWFKYTVNRKDCEIVGIVEINKANAKRAMEVYGIQCPVYEDLDKALEEIKPDLVYDLTYVTTHCTTVCKALKAGCNVFSEKPMTLTREEAEFMIETAEKSGKYFSVMQNRRYQRPVQAIKEFVESGRLGDIWMVSADIFVPEDLRSIRNQLAMPMLQDNAIHSFDQARYMSGQDAVSVYCHSYNPVDSKYKGDAAGTCIFEMSKGAVFVYNCVMGVEGLHTSWESSWRIIGSRGSIVWDGYGRPVAEIVLENKGDSEEERGYERIDLESKYTFKPWQGQEQHAGCLDEMFSALFAGRPSATDCHDNYKSMMMTFASQESAKQDKKIYF